MGLAKGPILGTCLLASAMGLGKGLSVAKAQAVYGKSAWL